MSYLVKKRREKVLKYLKKYDTSPLIFKNWEGKTTELPDSDNIDDLVRNILKYAKSYESFGQISDEYETDRGAMRSSFDIWRHAKAVKPDITIFQIMESLYNIRDDIYGHYCSTVRRGVFELTPEYGLWSENITDAGNLHFLSREYGITFYAWRNIATGTP